MLLTLAIHGDPQAQVFIYPDYPGGAPELAASILASKLDTYHAFNTTYAGYGGFLPDFEANHTAIRAAYGWEGRLSAADNGQLMWAIYGMIDVLDQSKRPEFQQLAASWARWLDYARENAKGIFMRGPRDGDICAISTVQPGIYTYATSHEYRCEKNDCFNNDPFEGELMTWFLYFSSMLNATEDDLLWDRKRPQLQATNYTGSIVDTSKYQLGSQNYYGDQIVGRHITPITVQRGLYFSSNENIKLLYMPYLDIPIANRVFKNAERVRTCNSVLMSNTAGMFASSPNGTSPSADAGSGSTTLAYQYIDNAGIPSAAVFEEQELDMITPMAVFPTILFDRGAGLAWYKNTLDGKQMQTVYGSTAATRRDGSAIARFVSWESKAPTLLALIGRFADIVRAGMKRDNIYDEFFRIVEREYGAVFDEGMGAPPLKGEGVPFCLPNAKVPMSSLIDFSSCQVG